MTFGRAPNTRPLSVVGARLHRYDHCSDASYVWALRCFVLFRYTLAWRHEFLVQNAQRRIEASMWSRHRYTQLGRGNHDFVNRSFKEIDTAEPGPNNFLNRSFKENDQSKLGPSRAPNQ